ncbi:hypothetical protein GLOIN_2v1763705 [Rhizophagus clarus]|uniref:Uncharacterized protein n=1 Tax=Rhizophagus clarus TaxID=94130 RepID=A0A8H3QJR1_9GLOM|nr:hypothetical protein GLOIN_2v1763705 [Rhizophagus clarus]
MNNMNGQSFMDYLQPIYTQFYNMSTMQHKQVLPVLSYLKFYYHSPNDFNFYLVICKIILQNSFNDHYNHDHEFFYQHPRLPSIKYHVTCKLIPYSIVESILNNDGECGMNFYTKLLSLDQKFYLEQNLKNQLYYRMYCTNSLHNDVANYAVSVEDTQLSLYNDNHNILYSQQNDVSQQNNFGVTR